MFEKSLTTLIKGLRSHRGRDEAGFIATEVRSADMDVKAEAILKLAYLRMLGYEVPSGSFPVLEAMASHQYHIKHIGYLAAALCFSEETEVLILATNLIKKDLHSAQPLDVLVALNGLSHVINQELSQHLANDIRMMLTHTQPRVRKRAVLVLHSAITRHPELLDRSFEQLRDLLCNSDQGVVTATVNVVCELARRDPGPLLPIAPQLFEILTQTSNNWLLIKVVKLFGALAQIEPRLVPKLHRPITQIISTTPAMSVLYECIHTAIIGNMLSGPQGEALAIRCVENLGQFLSDTDQNLIYIALLALAKLVPIHPSLVAQHQDMILRSLQHPDMTIQVRALDLVCQLATYGSMQTILDTLLQYVEQTSDQVSWTSASRTLQAALDSSTTMVTSESMPLTDMSDRANLRKQVAESILDLGSTENYAYVQDIDWYMTCLQKLSGQVDLDIARICANQMMDLAMRYHQLRAPACAYFAQQILSKNGAYFDPTAPESEMLRAAAWVLGEYASMVDQQADIAKGLLRDCLRQLPGRTVGVCIQSAMKLCAQFSATLTDDWNHLHELVVYLQTQIGKLVYHLDTDVHTRAQESLQLLVLLQQSLTKDHNALGNPAETLCSERSDDAGWNDDAKVSYSSDTRALHLLQPLLFTREHSESQRQDLAKDILPISFDLHSSVVPEATFTEILETIEPRAKSKPSTKSTSSPLTKTETSFSRKTKHKDPTRTKKKAKAERASAAQTEDQDLDDIPIVQLNLTDFAPNPQQSGSISTNDTHTAATIPEPKIVSRKKKAKMPK
ncbi:AP-3 complex subunit delta [Malassezia yamatoensis]|uniref:AP-3 complex subunit delta n=1 Tax=Malassezia yamatoensis TaxID=253288 RepID=A0AAJ6CKB4_9BASI|nr:AP-3 complex subunit delta [Malassezia yamatoensis]